MGIVKTPKQILLGKNPDCLGDCLFELEGPIAYGSHTDVFKTTIWGTGFEASRFIAREELEAIRDWCNEALASVTEAA